MYKRILKPLFDLAIAVLALMIMSPVFVVMILVLCIYDRGKIFFIQERIGYKEQRFNLIKFKTMPDLKDGNGNLLPDMERQSEFGNFLRHYHIDELPQLFNILLSDLSLIGPRPLLPEYLPFYDNIERTRHNTRPGITGLVQVMGGNTLTWAQRMRLDVFYTRHMSFALDCKILWMTFLYFTRKKPEIKSAQIFSQSFIDYKKGI
jgi:undecaprenyl phosphate N,N'-diacetylbacillosamine 1-phosphate transferase